MSAIFNVLIIIIFAYFIYTRISAELIIKKKSQSISFQHSQYLSPFFFYF